MNSQTFTQATQDEQKTEGKNTVLQQGNSQDRMPRRIRSSRKSSEAFRTISEVADDLDVQQHVLRFWETKFSQIRPLKRGGGRRYYRPEDLELLKRIHHLLYTEGYTIKGVQKLLRDMGKKAFVEETATKETREISNAESNVVPTSAKSGLSSAHRDVLKSMLSELKELREMVKSA